MKDYNPRFRNRKSIRLKGYDYAQEGLYFITLCCKNRAHLFGEIKEGKMEHNIFGKTAHKEWENTPNVRKNIKLHEFIIMPNHIHGIIEILYKKEGNNKNKIGEFKSPSQTIGSIIRGFKIATIKKIREIGGELQFAPMRKIVIPDKDQDIYKYILRLDFKIWQRDYYNIIIRDERSYFNISNYIKNNPKKWDEDKFDRKLNT